jgi:hypothetical protein
MKAIHEGEAALAIIGLSPVLKGEVPRWTLARQRELEKLPQTIEDLADKLVNGKLKSKPIARKHDYDKILERLRDLKSEGMKQGEVREILSKFPHESDDVATSFLMFAQNALAHLTEIFPVTEFRGFMGAKNTLPTADKVWKFFLQLSTLDDPLSIFNWIGGATILRSQAKMAREFYPTLTAAFDEAIYEAIARKAASGKTDKDGRPLDPPRLPILVTTGLDAWLDRRSVDYNPEAAKAPLGRPESPKVPQNSSSLARAPVSLSRSDQVTAAQSAKGSK